MIPGAQNEIAFWQSFVKTERFKYWCINEPNAELGEFMTEFITTHGKRVLDCGSGAISILHGLGLDLTCTDVLGDEYAKLLPEGIKPPIATASEDLQYVDEFDIVHMRNALDHCQDPGKAYTEMLSAVKPGGYLIIHGFENEATAENFRGMHQWDVSELYGVLRITNGEVKHFYRDPYYSTTKTLPNGKKWMIWIVKK